MAEKLIGTFISLSLATFFWWMLLKPSARRNFEKPGQDFWRLSKSGRESFEGAYLASYVIGALPFSFTTVLILGLAIFGK